VSLSEFEPVYITLEQEGDVCIVRFVLSQLRDDENIEQMGRELFALVEQYGSRKVVLSLAGVEYITSSVLGKMITLHRKLHRGHGMLVICEIPEHVAEILRSSRLLTYFNVADTREAAVAAFQ
jgi:anti-sigma B factor antagonist